MPRIKLNNASVRRWPMQWHEYHMAQVETKLLLEDAIELKRLADLENLSLYAYARKVLLNHLAAVGYRREF